MSSIRVKFSNPNGVYYPGSQVEGKITLNAEASIKARSVTISVDGRAHTKWKEAEYYTEKDTEGYQVFVEIDRKWRFNKTNHKLFTVLPTFDLNTIPQALLPVRDVKTKETGMALFRHGLIQVEVKVPKSGFVPGEVIVVDCIVDNGTTRPVISGEVSLNQVARCLAAQADSAVWSCHYTVGMQASHCTHKKDSSYLVATAAQDLDIPSKSKGTAQLGLLVPPCVASFNTCPIITVEYFLTISLHLKGKMNNTTENSLPIMIGTVPVYQQAQSPAVIKPMASQNECPPYPIVDFYPAVPVRSDPTEKPYPPPPPPPQKDKPDPYGFVRPEDAPPSYEESATQAKDAENAEAFAPRYPVYRNLLQAAFVLSVPTSISDKK